MRRPATRAVCVAFMIAALPCFAQEGGAPSPTPPGEPEQNMEAYPFFAGFVSGDDDDLDVDARIGVHESSLNAESALSLQFALMGGKQALKAGEAWIEVNALRAFFVKVGYFPETASVATIFPLINVYQSSLFSDLFRTGGKAPLNATILGQAKLSLGEFSFKASLAPYEPPWTVIGLGDPFFPTWKIPKEIDLGEFLGTYTLNETKITKPDWSWLTSRTQAEFSGEAAWQSHYFDARFLYFHGADRAVTLVPSITLPTYPYGTYNFTFEPERAENIELVGLNLTVPIRELSLYAEAAYQWESLALAGPQKITGLTATIDAVPTDRVSCLAGFLWTIPWRPDWLSARLMGEGRYTWITNVDSGDPPEYPSLSRAASLGAEIGLSSGALSVTPLFILSLSDWSQAYTGRIEWAIRDEFKLWAIGGFFRGAPESELGQYGAIRMMRIGVSWSL